MTSENTLIIEEVKLKEYLVAKKEFEKFQTEKLNVSIICSKAIWVEEQEKNTKYSLNFRKKKLQHTSY